MTQPARETATTAEPRRPVWGVYAVICSATGEVWTGHSGQVDAEREGLWAALRAGAGPEAALQAAWRTHGEPEFRFEELERLRDDYPAAEGADEVRKRETLWRARLQAQAL